MRIIRGRAGEAPSEQRSATFTGSVWADPVIPATDGVAVNTVFFPPEARTYWHRHERGQILLVTHGRGFVWSESGEGGELLPGDIVHTLPGERHWHGAARQSYLVHVAISLGTTEWFEEVTEAEYGRSEPS